MYMLVEIACSGFKPTVLLSSTPTSVVEGDKLT